jgi:Kef-type K+ transport system membrane component KefB
MPGRPRFSFSDARPYLPYFLLLLIFVAGVWLILNTGARLQPASAIPTGSAAKAPASPAGVIWENFRTSLSILLMQIIVILTMAGLFRWLFRRIGQPPVIGVVLFMFIVGMELNVRYVREKGSAAVMISHASIVVPFLLGTALSLFLYRELASPGTSFTAFALFIGVAMSITAFPVLARILEDRGLSHTTLGSIAITCAAVDDVTAWCILALVIALVKSNGIASSAITIGLTVAFAVLMILVVRPQLAQVIKEPDSLQHRRRLIPIVLAFVLACSLITETIGIHALFGAFVAGVVMPPSTEFRIFLKEKLEAFGSHALLPLFFAFTGLRTQVSLLNDWQGWLMCALIILVAIAGKLGGSMLMSRWTGMSWSRSFSIGVLMNTRGLVELVVLNIGYDLGILSGRIFAMMVLMALVTTFMTGPLLELVRDKERQWQ